MQFIRVEHPYSGKGIWNAKNEKSKRFISYLSNEQVFSNRHKEFPNPYRDEGLENFIENVHFCGFKSIEQMNEWIFKNELKEFISMGFKIYSITTSKCLIGQYQICYKKEDILSKEDITSLFL